MWLFYLIRVYLTEILKSGLKSFRRKIVQWSVEKPIFSLFMVIAFSLLLLPAVTAAALMPFAIIITYSGLIASQGFMYALYSILLQGLLLGLIVTILFFASFAIATSASVLHSYSFFNNKTHKTKNGRKNINKTPTHVTH